MQSIQRGYRGEWLEGTFLLVVDFSAVKVGYMVLLKYSEVNELQTLNGCILLFGLLLNQ